MSFVEFAALHGLLIDEPIDDGRPRRVPTDDDKPGKRSGWYWYSGNRACLGNWKLGGDTHYWRADSNDGLPQNPHEREIEAQRRRLEAKVKQTEAADKATRLWDQATPTDGSHPYLKQKQVKPHGLRRMGAVLLIPLHDPDGRLVTLQLVSSDGTKRFISGGRTSGCHYVFGDLDEGCRALLCEGWATGATLHEATGLPVVCAMNCGNLKAVAEQFAPRHQLLVCADDDFKPEEKKGKNPGLDKATEVAKEFTLRIAIPLIEERGEVTDFNDLHVARGLEEVNQQVEQAWLAAPKKYRLEEIAARLARMPLDKAVEQYERWQKYSGLTKGELKIEVAKFREKQAETKASPKESLEPWPDPVDGAELLNQLAGEFLRFLILPRHGEVILAVWNLHTYCFEQFDYSPILHVTAPTKQCAKSRVLDVLAKLSLNPKSSSNMTGATMFRTIEAWKPTLLLDEMDRSPKDKKEMITVVLNAGFHRDGSVDRCEGDEHKVRTFNVYCPKALAGIGDYMTDTVTDRSIRLSMQKKLKAQKVEKFRRYGPEELQRKCLRWTKDNLDTLAACRPAMPDILSDRQDDIWECLFAIAQIAGGEWLQKVWSAAAGQATGAASEITEDLELLEAMRRYLDETPGDRLPSSEICVWLNEQEDFPFKDLRKGGGIDQRLLSRKLKPFGITPRNLNKGEDKRPKGYLREEFQPVIERYLSPIESTPEPLPATNPENTVQNKDSSPLPETTVADTKTTVSPHKNGQGSGVADEGGVSPIEGADTQEGQSQEFAYVEEF